MQIFTLSYIIFSKNFLAIVYFLAAQSKHFKIIFKKEYLVDVRIFQLLKKNFPNSFINIFSDLLIFLDLRNHYQDIGELNNRLPY